MFMFLYLPVAEREDSVKYIYLIFFNLNLNKIVFRLFLLCLKILNIV